MLTVIAKTVITVNFRPEEVGEWQEHRRGGEKTTGGACVRWRLQHAQHLRSHPHDSFRSIKHPWYHTVCTQAMMRSITMITMISELSSRRVQYGW